MRVTRRRFSSVTGGTMLSLAFGAACHASDAPQGGADGRISARPSKGPVKIEPAAVRALGLGSSRDAVVQTPVTMATATVPLLVLLHGAGGSGAGILKRLGAVADTAGLAVLAPDSRDGTWDAIRGTFGADVTFVNRALERVFDTLPVDPARVTIGGFSDGATYALSLGLINGDLFRRILAFSPGFVVEGPRGMSRDKPHIFVSHGTADPILPIDRCSRVIVPALKKIGYNVTFREFAGGHTVPPEIATEGMRWASK
jgi:phospholipase/carboxylesterase